MTGMPEGWMPIMLKDLARGGEFFDGDWVESKDQDSNGTIRLVQLADVGEGKYRYRSSRWLREDQARRLGVSYLEVDDLLIARMPDPMGRCCLVPSLPTPAITAVDVAVLRLRRSDVEAKYVMWAINSPATRDSIVSLASGTTRQRVSRKNLGSVTVPLPPLAEQEHIVEILEEQFSRLDSALASIRAVREKAAAFRRSLLHSAFSGELSGGIERWQLLPVSKLGKWSTGRTPSTKVPENFGSEVPFVTPADLGDMSKISTFKRFLSTRGASEARLLTPDSVILVCIGATLGKVGWADVSVATNQQINALEPDRVIVSTKCAFYMFASPLVQEDLWRQSSSTTLPLLNKSTLVAMRVSVPPLDVQDRIVSVLEEQFSRLDSALEIVNRLEARITSERRSLLHAAFTGELTAKWRRAHV